MGTTKSIRSSIKRGTRIIIAVALMIALAYSAIGNPIVFINNNRLNREVTAINSGVVTLNEIVPFEWDAVYTFEPYANKEQIEAIIGFKSNSIRETVSEGMVQLLFVKNRRVVGSICGYSDNLGYSVDFQDKILYSDKALFSVEKYSDTIRLTRIDLKQTQTVSQC